MLFELPDCILITEGVKIALTAPVFLLYSKRSFTHCSYVAGSARATFLGRRLQSYATQSELLHFRNRFLTGFLLQKRIIIADFNINLTRLACWGIEISNYLRFIVGLMLIWRHISADQSDCLHTETKSITFMN